MFNKEIYQTANAWTSKSWKNSTELDICTENVMSDLDKLKVHEKP